MKIAVLSGKGGTGKTLVTVNLAAVSPQSVYVDCDVEEPNGYLFFKPQNLRAKTVTVQIPSVDEQKCNGCRVCVDFCQYNALAYVAGKLMIFTEICHSCGGCTLLCKQRAITEVPKPVGEVEIGDSADTKVITGIMKTGEVSGIPIIKELLNEISNEQRNVFIDCPPGSACSVMESIKLADYCVLVAEPTLFGVHNLEMVHELVEIFDKPCGVVLNKCPETDNPAEKYCLQNNLPILGKIAFDTELGKLNSDGVIVARENERYKQFFAELAARLEREVRHETATDIKR